MNCNRCRNKIIFIITIGYIITSSKKLDLNFIKIYLRFQLSFYVIPVANLSSKYALVILLNILQYFAVRCLYNFYAILYKND